MAKTKPAPAVEAEALPLEARVIQCISSFPTPKTTQDAVDQMAAEYMVANLLRQHAEKRYDVAKKTIVEAHDEQIALTRGRAAETMQKQTKIIGGAEWSLQLAANKPTTRIDVDDLRTQLIKLGVKAGLIDDAIKKVEKKSTPALIITASRE